MCITICMREHIHIADFTIMKDGRCVNLCNDGYMDDGQGVST